MPQLKGVIKTPTGEPLGGATITLTSLHNRAGILKGVFSHVTTQNGEYDFPVLPGVYSVRLTQSVQRLSEIGVIRVYEDSTDGSLNDFLGATDIDLRPEALKKFEELAQRAQQSTEEAGEYASAAEQAASDADKTVRRAVDKLDEASKLAAGVKASAEAAAQSEQKVQQIVDDLNATNATTTEKGLVQLCSDTDNDSEEQAATPKAVKIVMDEVKEKAPLDSPTLTGMPTTPTPSPDASGCEIANAEFVRALIAAMSSGSYSTDSVIPLVINNAQLQFAHRISESLVINKVQIQHGRQTSVNEPLVINKVQLQLAHQTRINAPLIINRAQLRSAHRISEPLVINKVQTQYACQTRANEPLVVNRMGLSFAFITHCNEC